MKPLVFAAAGLAALLMSSAFSAWDGDDAYRDEVAHWRQDRLDSLKEDDGWLTVSGLFWLKPGETNIGRFNKAVNLPCAYIRYATCRLAPPQNRLNLAIEAGELKYEPRRIDGASSQ